VEIDAICSIDCVENAKKLHGLEAYSIS